MVDAVRPDVKSVFARRRMSLVNWIVDIGIPEYGVFAGRCEADGFSPVDRDEYERLVAEASRVVRARRQERREASSKAQDGSDLVEPVSGALRRSRRQS